MITQIGQLTDAENHNYDPLVNGNKSLSPKSIHALPVNAVFVLARKLSGAYSGINELIAFFEKTIEHKSAVTRPHIILMLAVARNFSDHHPRIEVFCQNFISTRRLHLEDKSNLYSNLITLCLNNPTALQNMIDISRLSQTLAKSLAGAVTSRGAEEKTANAKELRPTAASVPDAVTIERIKQLISAESRVYELTAHRKKGEKKSPHAQQVKKVFELVESLSSEHTALKMLIPHFRRMLADDHSEYRTHIKLLLTAVINFSPHYSGIRFFCHYFISSRQMLTDDQMSCFSVLIDLCLREPHVIEPLISICEFYVLQAKKIFAEGSLIPIPMKPQMSTATTMQALQIASIRPIETPPGTFEQLAMTHPRVNVDDPLYQALLAVAAQPTSELVSSLALQTMLSLGSSPLAPPVAPAGSATLAAFAPTAFSPRQFQSVGTSGPLAAPKAAQQPADQKQFSR